MALGASALTRCTAERYFALVQSGDLGPDDRVELLEGVIVAMAPSNPRHASAVTRMHRALLAALGPGPVLRVQSCLVAGVASVPEPDIAVVPGGVPDYDHVHPESALLIVEVADSSLPQDRLTKVPIYAAAGISQYLIVNLRDDVVEDMRGPDVARAEYRERRVVARGECVSLEAFPGASVPVDEILPAR